MFEEFRQHLLSSTAIARAEAATWRTERYQDLTEAQLHRPIMHLGMRAYITEVEVRDWAPTRNPLWATLRVLKRAGLLPDMPSGLSWDMAELLNYRLECRGMELAI